MFALPRLAGLLLAALALLPALPRAAEPPPALRGMLVVNEDNSHFFGTRPPEEMTLAGLHAWVDQYAGTRVTHLFLSPNAMRASFRSRTREAIWDPVDGRAPDHVWPRNAQRLDAAGLDPYAVWIDRARTRGLSPWLSMRMNDAHSVDDPANFMHSEFWRRHPEFRRQPAGPFPPSANGALNFRHPEVRTHALDFLRELLERYAPDGLELDWMRFGHHLTPGREAEEAGHLLEVMREARRLTREWGARRGRPILLGVRVPSHPDAAAGLGMDAVAWARAGLVDLVVAAPFWSTSDFALPASEWRARLAAAAPGVAFLPGVEHNLRAYPLGKSVPLDLAALRGFAARMRHEGADGIYLFNWMDSQTRPVSAADYARLLREGLEPAALAGKPRRHVVTYRDTVPRGFPAGVQLPLDSRPGGTVRLSAGPGAGDGEAWLVAGLADRPGVATAQLRATLNGRTLAAGADVEDQAPRGGVARAVRFHCPPGDLKAGEQEIRLHQADDGPPQEIVWVEFLVAGAP
ncbi:MAG: hypothetical protein RL479_1674 [Verrucomicrobiota bacterium]